MVESQRQSHRLLGHLMPLDYGGCRSPSVVAGRRFPFASNHETMAGNRRGGHRQGLPKRVVLKSMLPASPHHVERLGVISMVRSSPRTPADFTDTPHDQPAAQVLFQVGPRLRSHPVI